MLVAFVGVGVTTALPAVFVRQSQDWSAEASFGIPLVLSALCMRHSLLQ